ncbi:helix-turn-helix domain-containing protein [Salinarimonas chemoclinalis]|uniref:helix-turn-helix domain-containing protein n=1 Tax=Salinarimonas chemoclinalis TaxID=3241599 RepID=UPI0035566706
MINAAEILQRLKNAYRATTDRQLAADLRVSTSTLGSWKARNSIPIELLVEQSVMLRLSLDYIVLGRGGRDSVPDFDAKAFEIAVSILVKRLDEGWPRTEVSRFTFEKYRDVVDMRDRLMKLYGYSAEDAYKHLTPID